MAKITDKQFRTALSEECVRRGIIDINNGFGRFLDVLFEEGLIREQDIEYFIIRRHIDTKIANGQKKYSALFDTALDFNISERKALYIYEQQQKATN